jgi:hypothetical protein
MTQLHAAPAMTTLVEAIHLDAPNGVLNAVVLTVVPTVGVFAVPIEVQIEVLLVVPIVVPIVAGTVVRIEALEAGQIVSSAAVRCWRRRSRGCPSLPSPKG